MNRYLIANIRQMPLPTNEPEHFEDWRPFMGFTDVDGCVVRLHILFDFNLIVVIQSWTYDLSSKYFFKILS